MATYYLIISKLFFQCENGWYGTDCSIPSVISSVREWPQWLRPAQLDVPDNAHLTGKLIDLNAVVKKKRPLIYVYDLPPKFNSLLLEVRSALLLFLATCKGQTSYVFHLLGIVGATF